MLTWKDNRSGNDIPYKDDAEYLITYEVPGTGTAYEMRIVVCTNGKFLEIRTDEEVSREHITRWVEIPEV